MHQQPIRRFVEVAKIRLKSMGKEPTPAEIVKYAENLDQNEIQELQKIAKAQGLFLWEGQIKISAKNLVKPHPFAIATLMHLAEKETEGPVVEIPLREIYRKISELNLNLSKKPPNLSILETLGIGKAEFVKKEEKIRVKLTAPKEHIEELANYYTSKRGEAPECVPLLRKAAALAQIEDVEKAIEGIHERNELGETIRQNLKKDEYKILEKILDPRYITPKHVAVLALLKKYGSSLAIIRNEEIEKTASHIGKYFSGGKVSSRAVPKHFRAVAGEAKKTDRYMVFRKVDQEAVEAVLNHLRRKHGGIDAALKEILG